MSDSSLPPNGEIILYPTQDGHRIECRFASETVWLSQSQMAELYQTTPQNITLHLKSIYDESELQESATCKEYLQVQNEGERQVRRSVKHYRLEVILSIGYRVRSPRGTQFRQWATSRLSELLVKGFVLDDERLKNPPASGLPVPDHFDELLERIRDIRASERRMYLRVKEIFALSGDYQPSSAECTRFFQVIQNKLHFAATGKTAAELIASRANHQKANMGLTAWKRDAVRKSDVTVAKNYLSEDEISELNRIVVMWLDYAEDQSRRRKQVFLKDWETKLNEFLKFNERRVLSNAGSVSKNDADAIAHSEYEQFAAIRRQFLEAEGERDYLDNLTDKTKKLPRRRKSDNLE